MNENYQLPAAFVKRINEQLGAEAQEYFEALKEDYYRGIRMNLTKSKSIPDEIENDILSKVPWWNGAYYLAKESQAGANILHEAGVYYLQEPSAMTAVSVLSPQKGERILDLCAAPGGKSTQIAQAVGETGLLVANEPVPQRAKILSRNIERMGIGHALVVSAEPEQLAQRWVGMFDAILVDAPCSGEGMFRRHPETREAWSENSPKGCAERQLRILNSAITMLKDGGRLVYSTCTLNEIENEKVIQSICELHPEIQRGSFSIPNEKNHMESENGMMYLYPHKIKGEGHFVALLIKGETDATQTQFTSPETALGTCDLQMNKAFCEFIQGFNEKPVATACMGSTLIATQNLPPLKGIKVIRAGLQLGKMKGKTFIPDHALALWMREINPALCVTVGEKEAKDYLRGETLQVDDENKKGFVLVKYKDYILGFGKVSNGQCKNHYPKGLRR